MRVFHWLVTGAMTLALAAPSWADSWHRPARGFPSYYTPNWQRLPAPQPYGTAPGYPGPGSGYAPSYPNQGYAPGYPNQGYAPPASADDGRHLWVYGSRGEGSFQQLPTGEWVERNQTGEYYFHEVRRTPRFIDLFDPSRGASARLTEGQMYHHGPGDPNWHLGYQGSWQ